ncbi:PACE efflux transporter [Aquabacterium sp.]|uniref:PACE efflux transporter n=1 Tax=Aquabacterium sp. TaxID=1872578 RepID=UPI002489D0DD|nr:PACE efflux transporter [Aquabacterium sp.]MDI1259000.1 PACE efflux transporter [Aquabacterium sp.]
MQGLKRKLIYVTLFELIAICMSSTLLALISTRDSLVYAGMAAVASSAIALVWNLIYTSAFEYWEARQAKKGRGLLRRAVHALGFELGLVVLLVPLFAALLGLSLWDAFVYDLGLMVFFMVYTFLFNLGFDHVFGLPASAMPAPMAVADPCHGRT